MTKVPDKQSMYRLWMEGEFGNRVPCWTPEEFLNDEGEDYPYVHGLGADGRGALIPYAIRFSQTAGVSWECRWIPNLSYMGIIERLADLHRASVPSKWIVICLMAPTHRTLINAEVMRGDTGTVLYCAAEYRQPGPQRLPMRESLAARGAQYEGLIADQILRHFMDTASWENLQGLFDRYPGSVVELSVYERSCGILGHNTLFWECRTGY